MEVLSKTSALGIIWQPAKIDESWAAEIARKFSTTDTIARLLALRVCDIKSAENFLEPKIRNLMPDPFHLIDMDKAVQRTYKAVKSDEIIHIFADYDVDGATSSACLARMFTEIGARSAIYVPDRIKEGYGPSVEYVEKIANEGAKFFNYS